MAKDERSFGQRLSEAGMVMGDGIQGIYGQRGNTYSTYIDAQMKRQALEVENQKYQQTLAQQAFENTLNQSKQVQSLYEKQQDSIGNYAKMGLRPVDQSRVISPGGNIPSRMTQGAYGQSYVPSSSMATTPLFSIGPDGLPQQMGSMPKGGKFISPSSMTTMDDRIQSALDKKAGIGAGAEAGRMTLAEEAINSVSEMRKLLYPDGTVESFNRGGALKANLLGRPAPNSKEGQRLYRLGSTAVAGRQLIQTGVAARPEETKALTDAFLANVFSNPESTYEGLQQLEDFYKGYLKKADPGGMFSKESTPKLTGSSKSLYEKYASN